MIAQDGFAGCEKAQGTAASEAAFHGSVTVLRDIAADHPAFAGHFPGRPLLPGVLLLAEVLEAVLAVSVLAARLGPRPLLVSAKFLAPVPPAASLAITLTGEAHGLRFEVRRGDVLAASGQWQTAPVAKPRS